LLESCYTSWATTIANFAEQQGLYAMSIANETDFASCRAKGPPCTDDYDTTVYTAKMMVAFVKVAGPLLKAKGVKVIAPEASEWIHAWSNLSATGSLVASHPQSSDPLNCGCYSNTIGSEAACAQKCINGDGYDYGHWLWKDQTAWNAFDIFGVHEYDSQIAYAWPADVNGGVRNKEVWQTEMSGVRYWPEEGPTTHIQNGVAVAGWIHSALTVGEASAWLYWWYEAYYQNDNEGLALIQGSSTIAKRYFTLGNYSKFVRPGYVAVEVAGNSNANVLLSAYKGTDGTVVVVAINKSNAAVTVPIAITGGTAPASMTPHVTSASQNLVAGTAVPVSVKEWGVDMDSRRSVLKKLLAGTAAAAAVPGTASAAFQAVQGGVRVAEAAGMSLPTGPSPWWLFSPVSVGTPLKFGWYVAGLSPGDRGAAVLTLAHTSGRKASVHLCAHNGTPRGLASTRFVDLVLMDGGSGSFRTDEKLGRVVLGLAERIRHNEASPDGDLSPVARMMTHDQRVDAFGAESLG
jgi:O-glycosyl hydrolase